MTFKPMLLQGIETKQIGLAARDGRKAVRYFFHTQDGQRTVDRVGTAFDTIEGARTEAVTRACTWVSSNPDMLIVNKDCRVEVTGEAMKPLFTIIMFAVDNQVWGGRS